MGGYGCWKRQHRIGCWGWLGHASSSCSGCCGHHCSGPGFRIRAQLPRPKAQTAGIKQGPGAEMQASEPFQPSIPISPPIASGGSYSEVWSVGSRLRWQGKGSIHVFKCSRIGPSLITFQELVLRI